MSAGNVSSRLMLFASPCDSTSLWSMPRTRSNSHSASRSPSHCVERRDIVLQHVGHSPHSELGEPLLKARPDERNFREIERLEESTPRRRARRCVRRWRWSPVSASRVRRRAWRRASTFRRRSRPRATFAAATCVANPRGGRRERLMAVDAFGAAQIHVPLVDARALDDRREPLEHGADLPALLPHARRGTGTHIAFGQSRSAREIGIADRTPNFLAS